MVRPEILQVHDDGLKIGGLSHVLLQLGWDV
jgi:hypothetical protein